LLARLSQRRQQAPLEARLADSQMFPAPVELVKLQLPFRLPVQYAPKRDWSFAASQGSWFKGAGNRKSSGGGWVCAARWSIRQLMA
jgi:hypothetical protein